MKNILTKFWEFIKLHKKYVFLILLTIIIVCAGIILFAPAKSMFDDLLGRKEIKRLKKEKSELLIISQQRLDSAIYYKSVADSYTKNIDSSKTVTIYIKQKTDEEVNNIRFAPVDSNIIKYTTDLEQYLSTRTLGTNPE